MIRPDGPHIGQTSKVFIQNLCRSVRTLALLAGLTATGCGEGAEEFETSSQTAALTSLPQVCDNQCEAVCFAASNLSCGAPCQYWDEHDGYRHCRESTCGAQVALPCNGGQASNPSVPVESSGVGYDLLSLGKPTWQSSTAFGGTSGRAVDGNADGVFDNGSVTHTDLEDHPEWGVILRVGAVHSIEVWNRTDCCGDRLSGANLWVRKFSNDHTWERVGRLSGTKDKYVVEIQGAANRVMSDSFAIVRDGKQRYLSLAEVRVWGVAGLPF